MGDNDPSEFEDQVLNAYFSDRKVKRDGKEPVINRRPSRFDQVEGTPRKTSAREAPPRSVLKFDDGRAAIEQACDTDHRPHRLLQSTRQPDYVLNQARKLTRPSTAPRIQRGANYSEEGASRRMALYTTDAKSSSVGFHGLCRKKMCRNHSGTPFAVQLDHCGSG